MCRSSDAHAGLEKAIGQVLGYPLAALSVNFLREALGHARRERQPMLAALLRPLFTVESGEQARELVGAALERLRAPLPKVAELPEEAEEDLLALYALPAEHRPKLRSTDPLALLRLSAGIVIGQNLEWMVGRRHLSLDSLASLLEERGDHDQDNEEVLALTAARAADHADELHHVLGLDRRSRRTGRRSAMRCAEPARPFPISEAHSPPASTHRQQRPAATRPAVARSSTAACPRPGRDAAAARRLRSRPASYSPQASAPCGEAGRSEPAGSPSAPATASAP